MLEVQKNNNNENNIFNYEIKRREEKLNDMKKKGFSFPNNFKKNTTSRNIFKKYQNQDNVELKALNIEVSVAGRMIQRRIMGKASFFTLQDMDGKIQIYVNEKQISSDFYNTYFKQWDIGDILGVMGLLFKTKTGELSIYCTNIDILNKSLKPLPDKFHGLSNQEIRYRKRYLDLISNNKLYDIFKKRSNIITTIRNFMMQENFLEVETPMLQNIPGGAKCSSFYYLS